MLEPVMRNILESESLLRQGLCDIFGSAILFTEKSSDFDLFPSELGNKTVFQPAAVLIPIIIDDEEPFVVFTRRAKNLRHHPGQIAFPGGKVEPSDSSAMETAIRESFEEIQLKAIDINILGNLPQHDTITGYSILPFVAIIKNYKKLVPKLSEVSEIFKVPLKFLLTKKNMQVQIYKFNGFERGYYAIPYGPYYIWGATARIIKTLADLIEKYEKI